MNTLFLDALSNFGELPVFGEQKIDSLEVINKFEGDNKTFERIILLQNGNITKIPTGFKNVVVSDTSADNVLNIMIKEAKNSDNVVVFNAANPFYDKNFIDNMFERHRNFLADYTYGVGYPDGLLPTILSHTCLKQLKSISENNDIDTVQCRDYLFQLLSKDINSFDVETFISPVDLRIKRISLGNSDSGESAFTISLVEALGLDVSYDDLAKFIFEHPEKLFSVIYGMFIDITGSETTSAAYVPHFAVADFVNLDKIEKIAQEIAEVNSKMHVVIGSKCEPMLHPDFIAIVNKFLAKGIKVIVETFGNVLPENLTEISDFPGVTFVFKIDAQNENTYRIVHPNGDYKVAIDNYNKVKDLGFKTYFQIARTVETESDIEKLLKDKQPDVLIKKYSSYCGTLPDKKSVDLSPLERFECYHLRRELYLDSSLNAYYCMYSDKKIGNAANESIAELMSKLKSAYVSHAVGEPEDFCRQCDDYYTFNF